jgi:phospholipid N-methyltransferase
MRDLRYCFPWQVRGKLLKTSNLNKNYFRVGRRVRFSLHLRERMFNSLDPIAIQGTDQPMVRKSSRGEETLLFAKNFLQHPRMLGSLVPSSRFLIDRLLGKIDWKRARTVVEYGPGVGTITAHILERMEPEARLVVFEMNEDFVRYLTRTIPDKRLHVVHGSAENVQRELDRLKLDGADFIISGIPFTTMPMELREKIMRESREALNPGGAALVYQFTRAVLPYLRSHFRRIDQDFEPRNILPARLFYCT